ncbi:WD40 domain-containing protein [Acanthopleuribacter pedis]|uniref:Caspase family protein n=1 Tax=Acanthopleuribacter pedis TaxID=442870 RepID=A0A8J7U4I3_9BACT|nr:caspase family protein [Acanthopleuribacter pedis]MBO1319468.1 caspase family protein [Acanthopleuribacter pedis]
MLFRSLIFALTCFAPLALLGAKAAASPEVVGQLMHITGLNDMEHHPQRRWVASASAEMIILWETTSGKSIRVFPSFSSDWSCLAFSPDGRFLAAGNLDHRIYLWDLTQKKPPQEIAVNAFPVRDIAFHPSGWLLSAAALIDPFGEVIGEIVALNPQTKKVMNRLAPKLGALHPVAFTPDGRRFIAGSLYHTAVVWDSERFRPIGEFPGNDLLRKVAVHPSGKTVAAALENMNWAPPEEGGQDDLHAEDGRYSLLQLDLAEYRVRHDFQGYKHRVTDLVWSPKGSYLYTSIADNRETRFNAVTGQVSEAPPPSAEPSPKIDQKKTLRTTAKIAARLANNKWVQKKAGKWAGVLMGIGALSQLEQLEEGVAFQGREIPQDKFYNTGFGRLFPYHKGGIRRWRADGRDCLQITFGRPVYSLTRSGNGFYLVADGTKGFLDIWDTRGNILVKSMRGATRKCTDAVFGPDGQTLAAHYGDKSFFLWHLDGRVKLRLLRGHTKRVTDLAFSPDGTLLVSASMDGTLRVWDPKTGEQVNVLDNHKQPVVSVAFSQDGTKLVSSGSARPRAKSSNGKVLVWDLLNPKKKPENLVPRALTPLTSPWFTFQSVAITDSGLVVANQQRTFMAFGSDDTGTAVFSLQEDGSDLILETGERPVQSVVNRSGTRLFTLSYPKRRFFAQVADKQGRLTSWSLPDGQFIGNVEGFKGKILDMALHPQGRVLVTTDTSGTLTFWDTETLKPLTRKRVYAHGVGYDVAGEKLMLLKPDGQIEIWDQDGTRVLYAMVGIADSDEYIITTPDHFYTASGRGTDAVAIVDRGKAHSFEQYDLTLNRPSEVLAVTTPDNIILREEYVRAHQRRRRSMGFAEEGGATTRLPTVSITNKKQLALNTQKESVTISVRGADEQGLARLHVKINDVPLHGRRGLSLKGVNRLHKKVPIPLGFGTNKIQVAVRSTTGNRSHLDTLFIKREGTRPQPNLYAVLIGVNEYQHNPNLTFAVKDAHDVLGLFEQTSLFDNVYHRMLTNHEASREAIDGMRDFLEQATVSDQIVVFLSGHGLLDPRTFDYYFATHDADPDAPGVRGYSLNRLEQLLDELPCRRKLVMLDTCYSGDRDPEDGGKLVKKVAVGKFTSKNVYTLRPAKRVSRGDSFALMRQSFVDLRRNSGSVILASSSGREISIEGENWQNGVFTFAAYSGIRSGLADTNEDQLIQVSELVDYLTWLVPRLSEGMQKPTLRQANHYDDFAVADTTEGPKAETLGKKLAAYLLKHNPFFLKELKVMSSNETEMFVDLQRWNHRLITPKKRDYPKFDVVLAAEGAEAEIEEAAPQLERTAVNNEAAAETAAVDAPQKVKDRAPPPENQNGFFTMSALFTKQGEKRNASELAARQIANQMAAYRAGKLEKPPTPRPVKLVYQWERVSQKPAPLFVTVGFENQSFASIRDRLTAGSYRRMGAVQSMFQQEPARTLVLDEQRLVVDGKPVHYLITKSFFTRREPIREVLGKLQRAFQVEGEKKERRQAQRRAPSKPLINKPLRQQTASKKAPAPKSKQEPKPKKKRPKWKLPKLKAPRLGSPKSKTKDGDAKPKQKQKETKTEKKKKDGLPRERKRKGAANKPPQFLEQCSRVFYHYVYRKNGQWVVFSFPAGDFGIDHSFDGKNFQYSFDYDPNYETEMRRLFDEVNLH